MQTADDPRHRNRRATVQSLFAESFTPQSPADPMAQRIISEKEILDAKISASAPAWPVDKLNKIDLAILRLAVFELDHQTAPPKVIIDEAIELAKEFGSESSASFVNGVLGTILKEESNG